MKLIRRFIPRHFLYWRYLYAMLMLVLEYTWVWGFSFEHLQKLRRTEYRHARSLLLRAWWGMGA